MDSFEKKTKGQNLMQMYLKVALLKYVNFPNIYILPVVDI
jgi:hypothetical protein